MNKYKELSDRRKIRLKSMSEEDISQILAKARDLFERARDSSETGDFDAAIDLFIEGLRCTPDAVHEGHIELRELALLRLAKGGEKPTPAEVKERLQGETTLEQMLGAEYLLAKDPGHLPYAEVILKAAAAGGYKETVKWIADLVFLANNNAKKPSIQKYLLLKDSYAAIGQFDRAIAACQRAIKQKGKDKDLAEELKKLSAKRTAARAKRNQQDNLRKSAKGSENRKESKVNREIASSDEQGRKPNQPPEKDSVEDLAKANVFFERAGKVSQTNNFDYAIDMYIEGLRCAPDALEQGHIKLHEVGLLRQGKKGKKPSVMEKVKRLRAKEPLEQMLNAEYLFAKDPDHLPYAEAVLKAAMAGGYKKTAKWFADMVFQANFAAAKPSFHTYILLKDSYASIGEFDRALLACQRATQLKPENGELMDEFQRLTAELTVSRGKYDQEGDFRQSIKDRESQERLQAQQDVVKTEDYRVSAVERARKALAKEPNLPKNIFTLADTLSDLQNDESENEAIELLEDTYKTKSDFSYKERAGRIRIKQLKRKIREAKAALEANPDEEQSKSRFSELSTQLNNTELEHYRLCVQNYPTDLQVKYEYGIRLIHNEQYDEAIPMFQEAQKDLRRKISAMDKIGFCFFKKGWYTDAIDIFTQTIDSYEIKDDNIAKELRYNLARSYEENGDVDKALEIYRKIAQLDFGYKDVRKRVDKLRNK